METTNRYTLEELPELIAICKLGPTEPIPNWALQSGFFSVSKTDEELSIVCAEAFVPEFVQSQKGWRGFRVQGQLDFALTGVLSSLTTPLAEARIGIFALSTFNTDYILVQARDFYDARHVLQRSGHMVVLK